ncbi:MAG TPA: haloacid dehalogenase type II [Anaeromyxobacteraceae bacterium]|nr:haloacid dehalogenase type II [Anaeromyxobacteraceae bacterium]
MTDQPIPDVQACVFDAYGTLFDVGSAAERAQGLLGERWRPLAEAWRARQLQYTWLRSLARRHVDFWQVTGDALDFALESQGIADPALRQELMTLYLSLRAYPDVEPTLSRLRAAGLRLAILSNGSPRMLASAVEHAGLSALLDAVLSVEEVGVYKPDPASTSSRSTGWASPRSGCASSPPTGGTPSLPRPSGTGCSGATGWASRRSASRPCPTRRPARWRRCRACSASRTDVQPRVPFQLSNRRSSSCSRSGGNSDSGRRPSARAVSFICRT